MQKLTREQLNVFYFNARQHPVPRTPEEKSRVASLRYRRRRSAVDPLESELRRQPETSPCHWDSLNGADDE